MAIDDGEKLLVGLSREGMGVAAAAWLKSSERGPWTLYIGLSPYSSTTLGEAYRIANRCLLKQEESWVQMSELTFVPATHPVVRDILAFRDRYPGERVPTRRGSCQFGGMTFEEAYVYPRVTAGLTRDEVVQAVTGLMTRAGAVRPSSVTLRDGTTIRGIPCGLDIGRNVGHPSMLDIRILDEADGSIRAVPVEQVANIL